MTRSRLTAALSAAALALALVLTGCSAPTITPNNPEAPTTPDGSSDNGNSNANPGGIDYGESMIDHAWPWPANTPRPNNIVYEFSGKNPLGEGAVRELKFLATFDEAQAYVDALVAAGWEPMLGSTEPISDDESGSVSWMVTTDQHMGAITTENKNDPTEPYSFSILG